MIFSKESALQQVNSLLQIYDKLHIEKESNEEIILSGEILVNRTSLSYHVYKAYKIEIHIPLESDELPYIFDVGNAIESNYSHRYISGKLCLETDSTIRIRFIDGFDLVSWMLEFVEPYFFSYEYYQRFGCFPFGERSHGIEGVLQSFGDVFQETDNIKVCKILKFIYSDRYRGHLPCPCGSGKKMRACHGDSIKPFFVNDGLKKIVEDLFEKGWFL